MLEPDSTVQEDLHGGHAPWLSGRDRPVRSALDRDIRCGVLVVGAGITGALVAQHLRALGHDVCIIDRERPGYGSTAASTAMLLWEIDCSLSELTDRYGFERAADIYRRSARAVSGLKSLVGALGLSCAFRPRHSLYLAGPETTERELLVEHSLRTRASLAGEYLDYRTLLGTFGFDRAGAIHSPGSADADPLLLAHALLTSCVANGARIFDAQALIYDSAPNAVHVTLDSGRTIEAGHVVLATGYVMPDFIKAPLHRTSSSWAIATPPQDPASLWRDGVLIWEASEAYSYLRTTTDNRIIIGGEDDPAMCEPADRNAAMPAKTATILATLARLCPQANACADYVWSGTFGETADGLPLIGTVPGHKRVLAAYGYGGNGITFSFLASRLIARMIAGRRERWHDDFALDRPGTTD
jgi:glycine/D-amino acid oxidase-like deaminating enzyme